MAQPTNYVQSFDFSDYTSSNPNDPIPGVRIDTELGLIKTTTDEIITNIGLIQRDDGELANESVHKDAFDSTALALMAGSWTPRGDWATSTAYVVSDVVGQGGFMYVCAVAHTSGTFATDLAAGNWLAIVGTGQSSAGYLEKSVAGNSDVTLTDTEAANVVIKLTGALTGNINVIVPTNEARWVVHNATSGAFTVTVKTSAGSGIAVTQGQKAWLYGDGTDVLEFYQTAAGSAISNVVEDTTPQLGGDLDANGSNILFDDATGVHDSNDNEQIIFQETASAVNHFEATNAATGNSPSLAAVGDDANVDLVLLSKGTGKIKAGGTGAGKEVVTLGDAQTVSGAKTYSAAITMSGARFVPALGTGISNTDVSAGALTLPSDGNTFVSTITDAITSIADIGSGMAVDIIFTAACTLTHHATDLILPGGANITTASGDVARFVQYATGDWRCVNYQLGADAPGGGGMTHIERLTASTSSSIDFNDTSMFDGTYRKIVVQAFDVILSADTTLLLLASDDGGASYATAYRYALTGAAVTNSGAATAINDGDNSHTSIILNDGGYNIDASDGCNLQIDIPYTTDSQPRFFWDMGFSQPGFDAPHAHTHIRGSGSVRSGLTSAMDAFQFKTASGTINSGSFDVWGIV